MTEKTMITVDSARAVMARLVDERGEDYVYDRCIYFTGDIPGCIVGHVLAAHGYGPEDVGEGSGAHSALADKAEYMARAGLDVAQSVQDDHGKWSAALEAFDSYVSGKRR